MICYHKKGDGKLSSSCKICRNKQNTIYRITNAEKQKKAVYKCSKQNREFIADYKIKNNKCTDCGGTFSYWILQFDHLRDKNYTISQMFSRVGIKKIKEEIEKCEIVCANCHRIRTKNRGHTYYTSPRTSVRKYRETERRYSKKCKDFVNKAKEIPCADCKIQYSTDIMEFDHIYGIKKFTLGGGFQRGIPAIKEEIKKCEVVCSNCHADRTYKRKHNI